MKAGDVSEEGYLKLAFIGLGLTAFHILVALIYYSSAAISLATLIGFTVFKFVIYIFLVLPFIIVAMYTIINLRDYSIGVLRYYSTIVDVSSALPYLNVLYIALSSIKRVSGNLTVNTVNIAILAIYLLISFASASLIGRKRTILVYLYKGSKKEHMEYIPLKESGGKVIKMSPYEFLYVKVYTRRGEEKRLLLKPGFPDKWRIDRIDKDGVTEFTITPVTPSNDEILLLHGEHQLLSLSIVFVKPKVIKTEQIKVVFEVIDPTYGTKNVRRYEIIKTERLPLSMYLEDIREYIPSRAFINRVLRKEPSGSYVEVDPTTEIPLPKRTNVYTIELSPSKIETREKAKRLLTPVPNVVKTPSYKVTVTNLYEQYDILRDDLW